MPARVPSKVPAIPRSEIISVVPTVTPPSLGENSLLQTEHFRTSARRDTIAQALLALIHKVRGIGILGSRGHAASSLLNSSGLISGTKKVKTTSITDPMNGSYQDSAAKPPPSANTHTPKAAVDTASCILLLTCCMRHRYSGVPMMPIPKATHSQAFNAGPSTLDNTMP